MIKYLCDLCGKEMTHKEHSFNHITIQKANYNYRQTEYSNSFDVCDKCFDKYRKKFEKEYKFKEEKDKKQKEKEKWQMMNLENISKTKKAN